MVCDRSGKRKQHNQNYITFHKLKQKMKTLKIYTLTLMLILFPAAIFSQAITLSGGANLPMGNLENNIKSGGSGAIEFYYPIGKGFNAFANVSYTGLPLIQDTLSTGQSYQINGLLGIKYVLRTKLIGINADAGFGAYDFTVMADSNLNLVTDFSRVQFGFNAGLGAGVMITELYDIVMMIRYNQIFSGQKFFNSQFGIRFNL